MEPMRDTKGITSKDDIHRDTLTVLSLFNISLVQTLKKSQVFI